MVNVIKFLMLLALGVLMGCQEQTVSIIPAHSQVLAIGNMDRFAPFEPVTGQAAVHVYAARHETEGFQVVVTAGQQGETDLDIQLSPLRNAEGELLPAPTIYRERYVTVKTSTPDSPYKPQAWPDILLPQTVSSGEHFLPEYRAFPHALSAGENMPVWVDVVVPTDAISGDYHATLSVRRAGQPFLQLPVTVTVWNFTLPNTPRLASSFGTASYRIAQLYGFERDKQNPQTSRLIRNYYDALLAHQLAPVELWDASPDMDASGLPDTQASVAGLGTVEENFLYYQRQYGVKGYAYQFADTFPFADALGQDVKQAQRFLTEYARWCSRLMQAGACYTLPTLMDEPDSAEDYAYLQRWGRFLDGLPADVRKQVRLLVTEPALADSEFGDLRGVVDTWVPKFYDLWQDVDAKKTKVSQAQLQAGNTLWAYTALTMPESFAAYKKSNPKADPLRGSYPPIWQLDYPAINYRLPAWLLHQYGVTGLLYYDTLQNGQGRDVWQDTASFVVEGETFNGDGLLLYPTFAAIQGFDGVVPSLRLKWLRESVDDYQYIALLLDQHESAFVQQMVQQFARSFGDWENDPVQLMAVRQRLGERLAALGSVK